MEQEQHPVGVKKTGLPEQQTILVQRVQFVRKEEGYSSAKWLQVVGTFFVFFNTWGLILSFGVFQTYYEQSLLRSKSASDISWIGTVAASLTFIGGWVTGPAFDKGFFRTLLLGGSLLLVVGYMTLSLVTDYAEALLAHGLCVGIGAAMLYIPSLSALGVMFKTRQSTAIALASSGGGIGGVVYPAMFHGLIPILGFPWTVRVIGFTVLTTLLITLWTMLPSSPTNARRARRLIDWSALKSGPFVSYMLSGFLALIGYYIPFVYLPKVGEQVNLSAELTAYLPATTNAAAIPGRIIPALVADAFHPIYVLTFSEFLAAALLFTWIVVDTVAGLIVWTIFWGFASGIIVAIAPAVIPSMTPSPEVVGSWNGIWSAASAMGILIGGPIGGALIHGEQLWPMQVFSGLTMAVAGMLCVVPMRHVYQTRS